MERWLEMGLEDVAQWLKSWAQEEACSREN